MEARQEMRQKVLSIDDNAVNQKLIERVLGSQYEVRTALSGTSGLEALISFMPDAILLDIEMNELDGIRLCRMIRAEPQFAKTPIIFVTCRQGEQDKLECFQAGGNDFLTKPIDVNQLRSKVEFNIERANLAKEQQNDLVDEHAQHLNNYLVSLLRLDSVNDVCMAMINTMDNLALKGAVHRHMDGRIFSSVGPLTDLETILVQQVRTANPPDYSGRFLWGSENIGVIIHNMPNYTTEKFAEMNQTLQTLLSATDDKLNALKKNRPSPQLATSNPYANAYTSARIPQHRRKQDSSMSIHGFKLECAVEELERLSTTQLTKMAIEFKALADRPVRSESERLLFLNYSRRCNQARDIILEHCLEIQKQYTKMMADAGLEEQSTS